MRWHVHPFRCAEVLLYLVAIMNWLQLKGSELETIEHDGC